MPLIALDWGTTSVRAYLLDERGTVIESRATARGVMRDDRFAEVFDEITAGWPRSTAPAIASGMVGSMQGWVRAPYVPCPAGVDAIADALTPVPGRALRVVPGLTSPSDPPDVMRGEETQIVGAIALRPALGAASCVVLPGTHSKWARVAESRVVDFTTFMTGELFAVLRDHSILGRPARDAAGALEPARADTAFERGVVAAQRERASLSALLFTARTAVLAQRLDGRESLEYLSGLLVGAELRAGIEMHGVPDALVGDASLCARYVAALAHLGHPDVPVVDDAAPAGLWRIARHAHIIPT